MAIADADRSGARVANDVLVVMAKQPVPGAVKTRLGRYVGNEWACRLYRAFLEDIASRFSARDWRLVWAVHPPGADLSAIVGAHDRLDQQGRDLEERMRRCFEALFARGAERVVMLGADAPHLPDAAIEAAFADLGSSDVTIVPTRDGGYCAIGMRAPWDLFSGVPMSTASVFAETRARAAALGLEVKIVAESFDVDEPEDLKRLEAVIARGAVSLPHVAAVLAERRRSAG
jgi:uncharacterized protein